MCLVIASKSGAPDSNTIPDSAKDTHWNTSPVLLLDWSLATDIVLDLTDWNLYLACF